LRHTGGEFLALASLNAFMATFMAITSEFGPRCKQQKKMRPIAVEQQQVV
jgi:hypothetical protein